MKRVSGFADMVRFGQPGRPLGVAFEVVWTIVKHERQHFVVDESLAFGVLLLRAAYGYVAVIQLGMGRHVLDEKPAAYASMCQMMQPGFRIEVLACVECGHVSEDSRDQS